MCLFLALSGSHVSDLFGGEGPTDGHHPHSPLGLRTFCQKASARALKQPIRGKG